MHTRFKNMFEGDMLLPNLVNNPDFQEKELLSLENDGEEPVVEDEQVKQLLSLAYREEENDWSTAGQADNWMYARSWFIPKSYRKSQKANDPDQDNYMTDVLNEEQLY